jgi:uncharacterized membrane protein YidH (DUF202 family)
MMDIRAPTPQPEENTSAGQLLFPEPSWLELVLLVTVTVMMIFLGCLTFQNLNAEIRSYNKILDSAIASQDQYALFSCARARDYAMLKSTTIFMGFIVIFVGCLYVLRKSSASFALDAGKHGSLQTTSPGLVMVTLGVLLVLATLHWTSTIEFASQQSPADAAANQEVVMQGDSDRALAGKPEPLTAIMTRNALAPVTKTSTCHASVTLADAEEYFGVHHGTALPFDTRKSDKTTIAWGVDELVFVRSPGSLLAFDSARRTNEKVVVYAHQTGEQENMTLVVILPNHTFGQRQPECRIKSTFGGGLGGIARSRYRRPRSGKKPK